MIWYILAGLVLVGIVCFIGWSCLALSGSIAQDEEDRYGVEKARRS